MPDSFGEIQPPQERRDTRSREGLFRRVEREFEGLAGLTLTVLQAMRLFHLERSPCERLLDELVQRGALIRLNDETYKRPQL